ncbi:hypothetical protein PFISCL1PPCAC_17028, partial [Pristionchus fissidentatus]
QFCGRHSTKGDMFALGLIYTEMHLPITEKDRQEIFDNYRRGVPNDLRIEDARAMELITRLTKVNFEERPTCRDVLKYLKRPEIQNRQKFRSKFADDFITLKVIGRGTFGCVFLVKNSTDEGTYALKRIAFTHSSTENEVNKKLQEVR